MLISTAMHDLFKPIIMNKIHFFILTNLLPLFVFAQNTAIDTTNWKSNPGIIGTLILVLIVAFVAVIIMSAKITSYVEILRARQSLRKAKQFDEEITNLSTQLRLLK